MNMIVRYITDIACDRQNGFIAACLKPCLWVLSCLYGTAVGFKRGLYQRGSIKSFRASMPVISVGNITAGGTGKTPLVVALYRLLRAKGHRPMVLTRGYMAGQGGASDEAQMLTELIGPVVFVSADRTLSFKEAEAKGNFDCVILDDGFQQWGFERDLDIVLVDSENPFGNGAVIPRGILREDLQALSRSDVVVLTKADQVPLAVLSKLKCKIKTLAPDVVLIDGQHQFAAAREAFSGTKVAVEDIAGPGAAFCAIGSPLSFRRTLAGAGVQVKLFTQFPDHYRFSRNDVQALVSGCRAKGIQRFFITHKDASKVVGFREEFAGLDLFIIDIEFILNYGQIDIFSSITSLRRT